MRKYTCLLIVILAVFLLVPFSVYGEKISGHKPSDILSENEKNYEHNKLVYTDWCEQMFKFGSYVSKAYEEIAFNIKFLPEPPKTDEWQTPSETLKFKTGDCEDAMLLFMDGLALSQDNAWIVWGWVVDNETGLKQAHVWCELTARDGEKYIVEGYSDDWNGIIPISIVEKSEIRRPTFKLSCSEFNKMYRFSPEKWLIFTEYREVLVALGECETYGAGYMTNEVILYQNPYDSTRVFDKDQVRKLVKKLHKFFSRERELW
ncbi:MAG: hypothetical protein ACE5F2_00450 [Candidatus Paceibacteria bacterium]